jgi:DNA-binding MarR family transcriptional regulator
MAVLGSYQPMSANDVCARTNMDKVQVGRAIAKLQKAGLVTRKTDNSDRRFSSPRLTAKGQGIHNEIVPMAPEREAELLAVVTEDELGVTDDQRSRRSATVGSPGLPKPLLGDRLLRRFRNGSRAISPALYPSCRGRSSLPASTGESRTPGPPSGSPTAVPTSAGIRPASGRRPS